MWHVEAQREGWVNLSSFLDRNATEITAQQKIAAQCGILREMRSEKIAALSISCDCYFAPAPFRDERYKNRRRFATAWWSRCPWWGASAEPLAFPSATTSKQQVRLFIYWSERARQPWRRSWDISSPRRRGGLNGASLILILRVSFSWVLYSFPFSLFILYTLPLLFFPPSDSITVIQPPHYAMLIQEDITDRIVAMGFPSESLEGLYRNNMKDVQKYALVLIILISSQIYCVNAPIPSISYTFWTCTACSYFRHFSTFTHICCMHQLFTILIGFLRVCTQTNIEFTTCMYLGEKK